MRFWTFLEQVNVDNYLWCVCFTYLSFYIYIFTCNDVPISYINIYICAVMSIIYNNILYYIYIIYRYILFDIIIYICIRYMSAVSFIYAQTFDNNWKNMYILAKWQCAYGIQVERICPVFNGYRCFFDFLLRLRCLSVRGKGLTRRGNSK